MGIPFMRVQESVRLLRLAEVERLTGYKKTQIYKLGAEGKFPPRRRLGGGRAVGWRSDEIAAWIDSRPVAAT